MDVPAAAGGERRAETALLARRCEHRDRTSDASFRLAKQRRQPLTYPAGLEIVGVTELQHREVGVTAADELHSHRQVVCAEADWHVEARTAEQTRRHHHLHPAVRSE